MLLREHSDLDAVTTRIYSCCDYGATNVAPIQKGIPLPRRRGGLISKHILVYEGTKISVMDLEETNPRIAVLAKANSNLTDQSTESVFKRSFKIPIVVGRVSLRTRNRE
jgi:hypothetical protein